MNRFNLMEAFTAVYEEGTYTAAAKRLGKTKALISLQISQLEEHLQVRLITRSTRSITFTHAGESYYHHVKQILDDINHVESRLRSDQKTVSGPLRISAPTTFGELVMSQFIAPLVQQHPKLTIDLMLSDRYVDIVNEGFDAAVRIGVLQDSSLVAIPVGKINMCICASPNFLKRHRQPRSLHELAQLPCIFDRNSRKPFWEFMTAEGAVQVEHKQPRIAVNSALAAANIAKQGEGICFCPDFAINALVENGELVKLFESEHNSTSPIHIVYPHRKFLSARVSAFTEELKKAMAEKALL